MKVGAVKAFPKMTADEGNLHTKEYELLAVKFLFDFYSKLFDR